MSVFFSSSEAGIKRPLFALWRGGAAMSKQAGAAAFRKTWDKEAFEAKAKERLDEELRLEEEREANIQAPQPIVQRAPLQRREADLQLTKFVNQRQMVTLGQAANGEMSGVYWCAVCQCHLRDSANYLLHINGKKRPTLTRTRTLTLTLALTLTLTLALTLAMILTLTLALTR